MSDNSDEVREYWINDDAEGDGSFSVWRKPWFGYIHVIEKSAYDALKAENERLQKQLAESWTDDFVNKLKKNWRDEVDNLSKENHELRLSHNMYNPCSMHAHINAENILKERDHLRQLLSEARDALEQWTCHCQLGRHIPNCEMVLRDSILTKLDKELEE